MAIDDLDRIHIRDLRLRCVIGVDDEERREKQDVVIQATMWIDLRQAGQSDNLADTVNYRTVKKSIVSAVEASRFRLVEALAERIAELCLENPLVARVRVCVDKPGALRFARSVGVEILRERVDG